MMMRGDEVEMMEEVDEVDEVVVEAAAAEVVASPPPMFSLCSSRSNAAFTTARAFRLLQRCPLNPLLEKPHHHPHHHPPSHLATRFQMASEVLHHHFPLTRTLSSDSIVSTSSAALSSVKLVVQLIPASQASGAFVKKQVTAHVTPHASRITHVTLHTSHANRG